MKAARAAGQEPNLLQVDFYQLTGDPDAVLARIAERVTDGGGRLLVVAADEEDRARIDAALWRMSSPSFLAHGAAGADDATEQPILLAAGVAPENGARNVALADGVWRDEALSFDRCFHLFDEAATAAARDAWRALGSRESVERRFWKQDEAGRWTQAA